MEYDIVDDLSEQGRQLVREQQRRLRELEADVEQERKSNFRAQYELSQLQETHTNELARAREKRHNMRLRYKERRTVDRAEIADLQQLLASLQAQLTQALGAPAAAAPQVTPQSRRNRSSANIPPVRDEQQDEKATPVSIEDDVVAAKAIVELNAVLSEKEKEKEQGADHSAGTSQEPPLAEIPNKGKENKRRVRQALLASPLNPTDLKRRPCAPLADTDKAEVCQPSADGGLRARLRPRAGQENHRSADKLGAKATSQEKVGRRGRT